MRRRRLTDAEELLCKYLFRGTIPAHRIEIVRWKRISGVTPRMRVNCDKDSWRDEYVVGDPRTKPLDPKQAHWFIHELCHIWQFFNGVPTIFARLQAQKRGRAHRKEHGENRRDTVSANLASGRPFARGQWGSVKFHSIYEYDEGSVADDLDLLDFSMEQQGDIIADWFALKFWEYRNSQPRHGSSYAASTANLPELESILQHFRTDPSYIRSSAGRKRRSKRRLALDLS